MATHSSTLALKIPWMEELGAGYYPWGCKQSGTTERLNFHFSPTSCVESSHLFLDSILPPYFSHAFIYTRTATAMILPCCPSNMGTKLKLESLPDVLKIGTKKRDFLFWWRESGMMWVLKLLTALLSCVKKTTEEMNRKQRD